MDQGEDILCDHGCGAVLGRREPHPERPRPATAGSGMACEACSLRERLRPALGLLRTRKSTPARIEGWGTTEIDHLEEHHTTLPVDDATLPMERRAEVSGMSRSIRLVQQAIEAGAKHRAWRHLQKLWEAR